MPEYYGAHLYRPADSGPTRGARGIQGTEGWPVGEGGLAHLNQAIGAAGNTENDGKLEVDIEIRRRWRHILSGRQNLVVIRLRYLQA